MDRIVVDPSFITFEKIDEHKSGNNVDRGLAIMFDE